MFADFLENRMLMEINAGAFLIAVLCLRGSRHRAADRWLFGIAAGVLLSCYYVWRYTQTLPDWRMDFPSVWSYAFFGFETLTIAYTLISIVTLTRTSDHSAAADAGEAVLRRSPEVPQVDIFIATYNEGLDVLEKTIVAALAIDYPNFPRLGARRYPARLAQGLLRHESARAT